MKKLFKIFKRNKTCSRCGITTQGFDELCKKCRLYSDLLDEKKKEEEKAKEEIRQRSWIATRDSFLEEYNGRR